MSKSIILLLVFLILAALAASASAFAKRQADIWNYYHFDGNAFTSGPATDGSTYVAIREKSRPVVLTAPTSHIELTGLPEGAGGIAGICYIQSAGGKLGGGSSGFKPYSRVPLLISSGGKQLVSVQTDEQGYFVVVLPAGKYTIGSEPFTVEITVERGITTLVPLRAGKRMVD
jgi:hypothetical protein